jgi:hypothetical protein
MNTYLKEVNVDTQQPVKKRSSRQTVGIVLLAAPTTLIILAILIELVMSTIVTVGIGQEIPLEHQPIFAQFIAICAFFMGGLGVLGWLPCLIIGIILLATKKK